MCSIVCGSIRLKIEKWSHSHWLVAHVRNRFSVCTMHYGTSERHIHIQSQFRKKEKIIIINISIVTVNLNNFCVAYWNDRILKGTLLFHIIKRSTHLSEAFLTNNIQYSTNSFAMLSCTLCIFYVTLSTKNTRDFFHLLLVHGNSEHTI